MADRTLFTNEQSLAGAAVLQTSLAASLLRFFNSTLVPTAVTTRAEMIAAEVTYTGYPAGGYPLLAFLGPNKVNTGGAAITSPTVEVEYASGAAAAIGGGWIDDGDDAPRVTFIFDPPRVLAALGDGFPFLRQLYYGQNSV